MAFLDVSKWLQALAQAALTSILAQTSEAIG
jgi:hypothetical protein